MSDLKTFRDIKEIFSSHANEDDAKKMAAYMRNNFDFYGIKTPTRRQISRDFVNKSKKQINETTVSIRSSRRKDCE